MDTTAESERSFLEQVIADCLDCIDRIDRIPAPVPRTQGKRRTGIRKLLGRARAGRSQDLEQIRSAYEALIAGPRREAQARHDEFWELLDAACAEDERRAEHAE